MAFMSCSNDSTWLWFGVALQIFVNLLFCGCIFGYASLQLIFEEDGVLATLCGSEGPGCEAQLQSLLLVYTLGSSFQVFSSFPVGILVDSAGPVICTALGGILVIIGLLCFGLAARDSLATFVIGSVLLSLGGTVTFVTSFLIGFVIPQRRVSIVMTALNCAFDGSTCIFLIFYIFTSYLKVSRQTIFVAYAIVGVVIFAPLAWWWYKIGFPILQDRKSAARGSDSVVHTAVAVAEMIDDCDINFKVVNDDQHDSGNSHDSSVLEQHTQFHKLEWYQQLNSKRFLCLAAFGSIHLFRANAYMGIIKNVLFQLKDEQTNYLYTTIYSAILPLGGIFISLIDAIIYRNKYITSIQICTVLGAIYGGIALIPILEVQVITFTIFCFFRALFYSVIGTYSIQIFGPINAGRSYGMVWVGGSVLNFMVWPALILSDRYAAGSYMPFNIFLLSLCLPLVMLMQWVLKPELERVQGASRPTRD